MKLCKLMNKLVTFENVSHSIVAAGSSLVQQIPLDMKRERIGFTFDSRDMLLSVHVGFSFIRAAVACAIRERISGFESSSETLLQGTLSL